MPKTRIDNFQKKGIDVPPPNYIKELMQRYMKAQKLSTDFIGCKLGVSGAAVRHMINRPASAWTIDELRKYCNVLNIPLEDALKAAQNSMEASA